MLQKWALHNNLSNEIIFSTSDSNYSNNSLAIDWLRYFEKHSVKE